MKQEPEAGRELIVTLRLTAFGTRQQARATAERIKRMLSVELHQDVHLVRVEYRPVQT